jgi:hypothetical protein
MRRAEEIRGCCLALWRYWLMASSTSEGPTWDALIEEVRCGPGTDARHEAGAWAMERVRSALGEDWPRRWHDRAGTLPGFVLDPASNACAYAQLLETGLRLHSLAGVLRLRRLTREWSRQLELIRMLQAFMQLEVAALARFAGAGVEFERPVTLPATSRPADVVISTEGMPLIAECFCVYNDHPSSCASTQRMAVRCSADLPPSALPHRDIQQGGRRSPAGSRWPCRA